MAAGKTLAAYQIIEIIFRYVNGAHVSQASIIPKFQQSGQAFG